MTDVRLTVSAGAHDRLHCPVSVLVPGERLPSPERIVLRKGRAAVPCQVAVEGDHVRLTWIVSKLGAGRECAYDVSEGRRTGARTGVVLTDEPGTRVGVQVNGELLTHYYYAATYARPFLHPLIGPYGKSVTRCYPLPGFGGDEKQDHPHHKSVWSAWGDLNGTDNWSEEPGHGRQTHRGFEAMESGPVYGRIVARNDWVSRDGEKVCEEVREIRIYSLPSALRMIDYTVSFLATEAPLRFGDTKEGGILSVRVASSMDVPVGGTITNSFGGRDEAETWGKRAHWCDYSGPVGGQSVGIAILDHPGNFRHPTYWHVRNYGLMTANPFGVSHFKSDAAQNGSHTVAKGQTFGFRYRLLVHAGGAAEIDIAERYHDFINPPAVDGNTGP